MLPRSKGASGLSASCQSSSRHFPESVLSRSAPIAPIRDFSLSSQLRPAPHGPSGKLVFPLLNRSDPAFNELFMSAQTLPSWVLSRRQLCDLEMILNGGFSPLTGFMNQKDYLSVVEKLRMSDGTLWPIPVTLDLPDEMIKQLEKVSSPRLALRDEEGNLLAVLNVEEVWQANKQQEAELVFGGDPEHPAIADLHKYTHRNYVGGSLQGFQLPRHYDYVSIRQTPRELRVFFDTLKWNHVVAFQTRNPLHRAHFELTLRALESPNARLLLHPVVGKTKPGDIDHHTRVKCYRAIMSKYPEDRSILSVLPLAMRMAGPREAVWHAIIRKNYGATHFILGRDHAGPGANSKGKDFYGPYDARDFALR